MKKQSNCIKEIFFQIFFRKKLHLGANLTVMIFPETISLLHHFYTSTYFEINQFEAVKFKYKSNFIE